MTWLLIEGAEMIRSLSGSLEAIKYYHKNTGLMLIQLVAIRASGTNSVIPSNTRIIF